MYFVPVAHDLEPNDFKIVSMFQIEVKVYGDMAVLRKPKRQEDNRLKKFFDFDENAKIATCRICRQGFQGFHKWNLLRHLERGLNKKTHSTVSKDKENCITTEDRVNQRTVVSIVVKISVLPNFN